MSLERVKKSQGFDTVTLSPQELEELRMRETEESISFEELLIYRDTHKKLTHV